MRTARFTALICFLMCTIGTVAHNDDAIVGASRSTVVKLGQVTPAQAPCECAACEWTSAIQVGSVYIVTAPIPRFFPLGIRPIAAERLASTPVRFTPLRGPPTHSFA